MKDAVLIKSFTNGITLLMREDASLEEILQELAVKFTEAKNFFGTSTMALSMEGREVSEVEEIRILIPFGKTVMSGSPVSSVMMKPRTKTLLRHSSIWRKSFPAVMRGNSIKEL